MHLPLELVHHLAGISGLLPSNDVDLTFQCVVQFVQHILDGLCRLGFEHLVRFVQDCAKCQVDMLSHWSQQIFVPVPVQVNVLLLLDVDT